MPGDIPHFAFGELICKSFGKDITLKDKMDFYAGCIIPDFAKNKNESHFRISGSVKGVYVPNMIKVKEVLYTKNDFVKLGMYSHLYLDYYFIEDYLMTMFIWDSSKNTVTNRRTGNSWVIDKFWAKYSEGGIMYDGYDQINHLMIEDKLFDIEIVNNLPENLPLTRINVFDDRLEKSWKDELKIYLDSKSVYTAEPFEYKSFCAVIEKYAKKFVEEIK